MGRIIYEKKSFSVHDGTHDDSVWCTQKELEVNSEDDQNFDYFAFLEMNRRC